MAVKVTGVKQVKANLRKSRVQLKRAISAGLIDMTTFIEHNSNKIAPREQGDMRLSSFTTDINERGEVQIGRVGYDSPYAPFVHEMPESNNFTTPGTGPKFLERTVKEKSKKALDIFFKIVTRHLKAWR